MNKPRIGVTLGDPAGVGPELCLRLLAEPQILALCHPVIFGDASVIQACSRTLGFKFHARILDLATWNQSYQQIHEPVVIDLNLIRIDQFTPGVINASTGRSAFHYVNHAIDAALDKKIAAITTAPLNKEAMHLAGFHYPGHTEILAERTNTEHSCMMQYSDEITCTFVTVHVGYREVPELLTIERILEVIELTAEGLKRIRGKKPVMVVCGLNPHAGEHGLFGDREEERIIIPAIDIARSRGHQLEGPLPADTAFLPAKRRATDAFICMYHDQGHIPLKALAFDSAVNTTLGLPVIRTSVDHGTALDIAWTGKAHPGSLFAAIDLAVRLAK